MIICVRLCCFTDEVEDAYQTEHTLVSRSCSLMRFRANETGLSSRPPPNPPDPASPPPPPTHTHIVFFPLIVPRQFICCSSSLFVRLWLNVASVLYLFVIKTTYLYNCDPIKPHFYIVKLEFTGVQITFLMSAQNIDCGYSLEPSTRNLCFEQIYEKCQNFNQKTFIFWW